MTDLPNFGQQWKEPMPWERPRRLMRFVSILLFWVCALFVGAGVAFGVLSVLGRVNAAGVLVTLLCEMVGVGLGGVLWGMQDEASGRSVGIGKLIGGDDKRDRKPGSDDE